MEILKYILISILALFSITLLIIAIKSKKPFRFIIFNGLIGVAVLLILHFTQKYTGINLPVNQYTVVGSVSLGVPSIIGFLISNIIFL